MRPSHPEGADEYEQSGRTGDETSPPDDGLRKAEAEFERDCEQNREDGDALLVEQFVDLVVRRRLHDHAGCRVPAKTCQASADFAKRLSSM